MIVAGAMMGFAVLSPSCELRVVPSVSLREAKRRGNLVPPKTRSAEIASLRSQ
jgi:hypothetical protein